MQTRFGQEANDGDYVIVMDVNYIGRSAKTYIAKVYNGKAYTGKTYSPAKPKYIHKNIAEVVIHESIVPDETRQLIEEDIKIHNKDYIGEDVDEWEETDWDDEDYIPSSTRRDYSPSNPWDAPGMSIKDFIYRNLHRHQGRVRARGRNRARLRRDSGRQVGLRARSELLHEGQHRYR